MESIRNKVQLVGYTGKDPEIMKFSSGSQKANLSLATSSYYKSANGEFQTETHWHNVIAWGKTAENLHKMVKKGDHIIIAGSIQYRSYEDKNGINRKITEILISNFMKTTKDKAESDAFKMEKDLIAEPVA